MPHVETPRAKSRRQPRFIGTLVLAILALGFVTGGCITKTDPRANDPDFGTGWGEYTPVPGTR